MTNVAGAQKFPSLFLRDPIATSPSQPGYKQLGHVALCISAASSW